MRFNVVNFFNKKSKLTETKNATEELEQVKNPMYKKVWFWGIITIIIIGVVVTVILIVTREVKPKFDKDGNPVFVQLTDEVYTRAEDYLGYHINVKGKVFQVLGDTGTSKGIQIWLNPETSEQNMWIYYSNDVDIKQGDYIICSGYIKSISSYDNNYGAKLSAPLVVSNDMKKSNYIEVMSPTNSAVELSGVKAEQYGYSITVDKVEFSEKETRIYFTADNKGGEKMYTGVDDAIIIQNGKQYNADENHEAEYEEIPYELYNGAASSGIVSFPAIKVADFQLIVEIHSDNMDEEFEKFIFNISPSNNNGTVVPIKEKTPEPKPTPKPSTPTYASIVGTFSGTEVNMGSVTATFYGDGTLSIATSSESFTGTWSQTRDQAHFTLIDPTGFEWTAQDVTVSKSGIDGLWGEFFSRIS